MVDAGEIFAEIDASAGMVRFLEDPEQYTSSGALQHLNTTIQASFSLAQQLQAVNTQVICLRQLIAMQQHPSNKHFITAFIFEVAYFQTGATLLMHTKSPTCNRLARTFAGVS